MTVSAPVVLRPRKLVLVCRVGAVAIVVVFGAVATTLRTAGAGQIFGLADQIAMFVLGLLLGGGLLSLTRARVEADATGVRVRNVVSDKAIPWQVVRAVRLDDGSPWASLELEDDDTLAMLGIQANDGALAVDGVLALRRLLRESRTAP